MWEEWEWVVMIRGVVWGLCGESWERERED
jgi:hypothetical protein